MTTTPTAPLSDQLAPLRPVAQGIRECAEWADPAGRGVLRSLADAVQSGHPALRGVTLATAFPVEILLPDPPRAQGSVPRVMAIVRDVLVFAPIGVTWWFLYRALSLPSTPGGTLLADWATGYGGKIMTLSQTAMIVAGLVGLIIVLTLLIPLLEWRGDKRSDRGGVRRLLADHLSRATLLLGSLDHDTEDPVTVRDLNSIFARQASASRRLADQIETSTTDLVRVLSTEPGGQLRNALDAWVAAAADLRLAGERLTAPVELFEDFLEARRAMADDEAQLRNAMEALVVQVHEATDYAGAANQAQEGYALRLRDLASDVSGAMQSLSERSMEVLAASERVYEAIGALTETGLPQPTAPDTAPAPREPDDLDDDDEDLFGGGRQ